MYVAVSFLCSKSFPNQTCVFLNVTNLWCKVMYGQRQQFNCAYIKHMLIYLLIVWHIASISLVLL